MVVEVVCRGCERTMFGQSCWVEHGCPFCGRELVQVEGQEGGDDGE